MGSDKLFQKRKKKAEVDLQRREEQRLTTITILIVGEGVTEYNYFNEMRRILRGKGINIVLEKPRGSAPISVIDFAIDFAIDFCERNDDIDYAFCVFDQDEHPTFHAALDKLNRYKPSASVRSKTVFKAIPSIPCFEIWLFIHFTYTTKGYARSGSKSPGDIAYDDLLRKFPQYSKTMTDLFSKLKPKLDTAITHAKRLSKYNATTNTTNPSTNMHEIIEFIREKVGVI
ncbi:MAG: RloB domain-containing protein [Gammaproteobacteria bacterium]|nr:RloB domain-containing protein [Gammaproteobacteria bacterium]